MRNIGKRWGKKKRYDMSIYFSFHSQTLFVKSSRLNSILFMPSDASILSTTSWKKVKKKQIKCTTPWTRSFKKKKVKLHHITLKYKINVSHLLIVEVFRRITWCQIHSKRSWVQNAYNYTKLKPWVEHFNMFQTYY